jgi:AraC-like DNA-binding protein
LDVALLDRLLAHIETAGNQRLVVDQVDVAQRLQLDVPDVERLLVGLGMSWKQFRRAAVMRDAVGSLAHGDEYVSQTAYRLGYDHASAFDRDFRLFVGTTPGLFRELVRS